MMKVTLKAIADETGVSQMTVSRILRGKAEGQVSPGVRARVVASLAAHRYDFQKTARKSSLLQKTPERKIVAILPYREFLSDPPDVNSLIFYRSLEDHCRANGIRLEYVVGLRNNDNNVPAWEELQKIPPGTPVLFHSSYGLTSAIALQQQGCRVGLVLRDLFWRNFYAPQLKKMSCFTMETAEGISGTIRAMRLSGCRRIACSAMENYLAEPGFPPLAAYEYERRINGIAYRHVIPLAGSDGPSFRETIRRAYEENPFDGLHVSSRAVKVCPAFRRETGLPSSVKLSAINIPESAAAEAGIDFLAQFSYGEIIADAVDNLLGADFKPVQRSYGSLIRRRSGDDTTAPYEDIPGADGITVRRTVRHRSLRRGSHV